MTAFQEQVNYKLTAGHDLDMSSKVTRDVLALRASLHVSQTIGDAQQIAERLGYDLVLTHVVRTEPTPQPRPIIASQLLNDQNQSDQN